MKKAMLLLVLAGSMLSAQNRNAKAVVPPAEVSAAFEKEFPKMKPSWTQDYEGSDKSDVRYQASFSSNNANKMAEYDKTGNLKAVETSLQLGQLPPNIFHYIRKNYAFETIKEAVKVVDGSKNTTYEIGIQKDNKFFDLVFDAGGNFVEQVEKN